jgi:hypothetical protein
VSVTLSPRFQLHVPNIQEIPKEGPLNSFANIQTNV